MKPKYTIPLDDPNITLETVGGKGVSLSKLADASFPVPGGFHLTTKAYHRFIEQNELQPKILKALDEADISATDSLNKSSEAISIFLWAIW